MANTDLQKHKRKNEQALRAKGYMTIDEFIERITPAMREYMLSTWTTDENDVYHPEDLGSHALAFMEAIFIGLGTFGAGPTH